MLCCAVLCFQHQFLLQPQAPNMSPEDCHARCIGRRTPAKQVACTCTQLPTHRLLLPNKHAVSATLLQFYPPNHITVSYSVIEASIAISQIIAAPVAAGLLQLTGLWGLAGVAKQYWLHQLALASRCQHNVVVSY